MFKKIVAILLVLCLVFAFAGCKSKDKVDTSSDDKVSSIVDAGGKEDTTTSEEQTSEDTAISSENGTSSTAPTSSTDDVSQSQSTPAINKNEGPEYLKGTYCAWVKTNNDFSDYARYTFNFQKTGAAEFSVVYYKAFDKNTITPAEKEALNKSIKGEFIYYYTKGKKTVAFNWPSCGVRPANTIDDVFEQRLMGETYHYNDTIVVCSDFAKDASAIETMDSECREFTHKYDPNTGKITTEGITHFSELSLNEDNTMTINGQKVIITDSFTKYMQSQ